MSAARAGTTGPRLKDLEGSRGMRQAADLAVRAARGIRLPATQSGRARLTELDDALARELAPGDVVVRLTGSGLGPVVVGQVRTGIAGDDPDTYEVPVVDGVTGAGRALTFAPEDLCRVDVRRSGVPA